MKLLILLLAVLQCTASLKILLYNPGFGHSHMRFMGRISTVLTEAGHALTEVRPAVDSALKWEGVSKTKDVLVYPEDPLVAELVKRMNDEDGFLGGLWTKEMTPQQMSSMMGNMTKMFVRSCDHILYETDLVATLKKRKFDLGITEAFDPCGFAIFKLAGVENWVSTSSSNLLDHQAMLLGVPLVPSYVPGPMTESTEKMTLFEKTMNAVGTYFGGKIFLDIFEAFTENFKKRMGTEYIDVKALASRSAMLFTNTQNLIDFPKPTLHKIVDIGGIHIKDTSKEKLDEEWNKILNRKKKNVLISFGSVAKSSNMPQPYKKAIIKAAREMPDVLIIWKYEADDLPKSELPENLYLSKWTPQNALLADPRLNLFLTHGGLASTTEIAYSGTPSIVTPLFADQPRNAKVLLRHGGAEKLRKFDLANSEKIKTTIMKILDDPSYETKAKELSIMLKNPPFTPKELLVRNVEFVGRFGSLPQLDPYGRQLSFFQYYLLDIISIFLVVTISVILLAVYLIKSCLALVTGAAKMKSD
ncbi:unnamed protein product, partial [Mesorhabditis spiculigera]